MIFPWAEFKDIPWHNVAYVWLWGTEKHTQQNIV